MVMPGDDGKFGIKLITPIAMSQNLNLLLEKAENCWSWRSNEDN